MTRYFNTFVCALAVALAMTLVVGSAGILRAEEYVQPVTTQAKPVIVDNFESGAITNSLGGRTNVFLKAPSKAMVTFRRDIRLGRPTNVLMIKYDKKAEGGPQDQGGWCGYYTLLKKAHPALSVEGSSAVEAEESVYLDGSKYSNITLWVKADKGNENFVLGVADAHWDKIGDSVKSMEIGRYLPSGKLTTEWQKAVIPLEEFFIDYAKLSSISIVFESDCFPEGAGAGKIYIDDITLE